MNVVPAQASKNKYADSIFLFMPSYNLLSWLRVRVDPDISLLSVTDFRFIVERLLLAENSNTAASALG